MQPFLSCVMPTRRLRCWSVPLGIERYLAQTPTLPTELVIVDDPDEGVRDVVTPYTHAFNGDGYVPLDWSGVASARHKQHRIRYVVSRHGGNAGQKWNAACEAAEAPWIALWGDDDWYAADRCQKTIDTITRGRRLQPAAEQGARSHEQPHDEESDIDLVGAYGMLIHELVHPRRTFQFTYPPIAAGYGATGGFSGGTIAVRKAFWGKHPFPELAAGSDSVFCTEAIFTYGAGWRVIPDDQLLVAHRHDQNTGNTHTPRGDAWWQPWKSFDDLRTLTEGMVDAYAAAYLARNGTPPNMRKAAP